MATQEQLDRMKKAREARLNNLKEERKTETQEQEQKPVGDATVDAVETVLEDDKGSANQPMVLLSETDAYIHERMKSQPKNFSEISIEVRDPEATNHVLVLPKELEKYGKEYSFRWINKKKRAIDHALDVVGWSIVNRVLFKDTPKHLFTANGSIERGDAILGFMPRRKAEAIRLRPAQISRERVRNTPVQDLKRWEDRGENYYKPDLGAAENDNEKPVGISVTPDTDIKETEQ